MDLYPHIRDYSRICNTRTPLMIVGHCVSDRPTTNCAAVSRPPDYCERGRSTAVPEVGEFRRAYCERLQCVTRNLCLIEQINRRTKHG